MKKVFMFTETRSWYFELDVDEGAQVEEALSALVGTEGFNYYLTDRAEDEYKSTWQEMPEDWRSGSDPDYTEDFRSIAKQELKGENLKIVLASLTEHAQ